MSESFDPYRKWLGIPPKDQPPHHYRLLGIAAFEDDPDVIENAAARQMSHLRTFSTSKNASFAQRLLTEISAAKLCLLTRDRKAAYDAQLRGELSAAGKLSGSQILPPPPVAVESEPEPAADNAVLLPPRPGSRWREEGMFDAVAVAPAPVPIPMPPPPVATLPALGAPVFQGPAAAASATSAAVSVPVVRRPSSTLANRARRKRSALPMMIIVASVCLLMGAAAVALVLANRPAESAVPPATANP